MTPTTLLPWQHSWLQSLSVKNQLSLFVTFSSGTEGLARNTHGSHIVSTLPIRLVGVDDPCLRKNVEISAVIKTDPPHNCCHANYTMGVIMFLLWCTLLVPSLKNAALIFLELFLIWVLCCFSGTAYGVITFNTKTWISLKRKKDIPERKTPFFFTLKSLSNKQQLFFT